MVIDPLNQMFVKKLDVILSEAKDLYI